MDMTFGFCSFGLGGVIVVEEVDLVEVDEEVVVVIDVFVWR